MLMMSPRQRRRKFFLLLVACVGFIPEEEGMMQHSRVSISLSYETKVIEPVGESHNTSLAVPAHKQQILAPNANKGLSIPWR